MKFETSPYDPTQDDTEGGLLIEERDITAEFPIVEHPEEVIDDIYPQIKSREVEQPELVDKGAPTFDRAHVLESEIQSGVDTLRAKIKKSAAEKKDHGVPSIQNEEVSQVSVSQSKTHELESEIQLGIGSLREAIEKKIAQKSEAESEAYAEDVQRDEVSLEKARVEWRERVQVGQEQKEKEETDMAMRMSYEDLRAGAFNRITPLEHAIKALNHTISLEENELIYLHEKESIVRGVNPEQYEQTKREILEHEEKLRENQYLLDKRQVVLDRVSTYEHKLWGDTPQDLFRNSEVLWANINNCESRKEFLALFDTWGALPGVEAISKPLTNKEEVERFLSHMDGKEVSEIEEEAGRLFENTHLRNLVLELPKREQEQEVIAKNTYEAKQQEIASSVIRKGAHFSRESVVGHVEKELSLLHYEERDLTEAKSILQSKVFRFAPFMMNFTKGGREKLSILKRIGLDRSTVGSGNKNLEFARVFRLKAVREKEAAMQGQVEQRFADNLEKREWSQDRTLYDSQHPILENQMGEVLKDRDLLKSGMKNRSVGPKKIQEVLQQRGRADSFLERALSAFFGSKKTAENPPYRGATMNDIITPDQVVKSADSRIVQGEEVSEVEMIREKIRKAEIAEAFSKEVPAVYTEVPKKEKEKKGRVVKTTGKSKKRSPKKRLL